MSCCLFLHVPFLVRVALLKSGRKICHNKQAMIIMNFVNASYDIGKPSSISVVHDPNDVYSVNIRRNLFVFDPSNLIELRNFGYKIKVCNLICCLRILFGRYP